MTFLTILVDFFANFGWLEIIILQSASIVLGYFIHFFVSGPRVQKRTDKSITDADTWRMKFYEEQANYKKLQEEFRATSKDAMEQIRFSNNEIEVLKQEIDQLEELLKKYQSTKIPANYLDQLYNTQHHLIEHQQNIHKLLQQIEDYQNRESQFNNALELTKRLQKENHDLRLAINERDGHIEKVNQELELYADLRTRLEQSYTDYKELQEKLVKVETYISSPKHRSFDYDELQYHHLELAKEYDDAKSKQFKLMEENQRLVRLLTDTEDRLKEANFQRQQLQKKMTYLEAFNKDLQLLCEQNKKLDTQVKRMLDVEHQLNKKSINND
ncbi:coiled-coil domain-containing protein [Gynurincola endophyticus]|uniref:hypothetical protein n=1 Tax=Gynurincola endophyticus TaxID=2479004 RepID=UPI000F8F3B1A|nr:hypothetical protein [Gynurincola endophyticus]